MTETALPSLDFAQKTFKSLVWDNALTALLNYLFGAAWFLNIWPIRQIIEGVARLCADKLYDGIKLIVDMETISLMNSAAQKEYDRAYIDLKLLARDKGIDSEEFKNAREKAKQALSDFVRYGATRK